MQAQATTTLHPELARLRQQLEQAACGQLAPGQRAHAQAHWALRLAQLPEAGPDAAAIAAQAHCVLANHRLVPEWERRRHRRAGMTAAEREEQAAALARAEHLFAEAHCLFDAERHEPAALTFDAASDAYIAAAAAPSTLGIARGFAGMAFVKAGSLTAAEPRLEAALQDLRGEPPTPFEANVARTLQHVAGELGREHDGRSSLLLVSGEEPNPDHEALYDGAAAYASWGDDLRAEQLLGALLRSLGKRPSVTRALALHLRGLLLADAGDAAGAAPTFLMAAEVAEACSGLDPVDLVSIAASAAEGLIAASDDRANDRLDHAATLAAEHRHPGLAIEQWSTLARRLIDGDAPADALPVLERACQAVDAPCFDEACDGHDEALPSLHELKARALFAAGDAPRAYVSAKLAADDARALGTDDDREIMLRLGAAQLANMVGEPGAAIAHATRVVALLDRRPPDDAPAEGLARTRREAQLAELEGLIATERRDEAASLGAALRDDAQARGDHHFGGRVSLAFAPDDGARDDDATDDERGPRVAFVPEWDDIPELAFPEGAYRVLEEARAAMSERRLEPAIAAYERALAQQMPPDGSLPPEGVAGYVTIVEELAAARTHQGDNTAPLVTLIRSALELTDVAPLRFGLLRELASVQHFSGAMVEAIATLDEALALLPVSQRKRRAAMLMQLGDLHCRLHRVEDAIRCLDEADELGGGDPDVEIRLLQMRARIEGVLNRYDVAVELLDRALARLAELPPDDHWRAMLLVDRAHDTADRGEAIPFYREAIPLIEASGDRLHLIPAQEGLLLARIATSDIGENEGVTELRDLLRRRQEIGDFDGAVTTAINYARQVEDDAPDLGREIYDETIALAERTGATGGLIVALIGRAELDESYEGGIADLQRACTLIVEQVERVTDLDNRVDLIAERTRAFSLLAAYQVAVEDGLGLFATTERLRGLGLRDLVTAHDLRDAAPPALRAEEAAAFAAQEAAWVAVEEAADADEAAAAGDAARAARERIRRVHARMWTALPGSAADLDPQDLMAHLGARLAEEHAVLALYTCVSDDHVIVQCLRAVEVVTRGDTQEVTLEITDAARDVPTGLGQRVAELAASVAGGLRPLHAASLYQDLVAPLEETIGDRTLIVVADGPLHQLPFAALLTAPPDEHEETLDAAFAERRSSDDAPVDLSVATLERHLAVIPEAARLCSPSTAPWLVRRWAIRVLPTVGSLIDAAEQTAPVRYARELAAFIVPGDHPSHDDAQLEAVVRRVTSAGTLPPLTHALSEGQAVLRALGATPATPGFTLKVETDATRTAFEQIAGEGCRWLHLACHALIDPERPWASQLVLGGSAAEDTRLRAASLLRRRLSAELVVLSCCDTGLGRIIPGEGVLGLPRAFLAAGARAVCVTLWPVLDEAGPPLMSAMYRRLKAGAPPWQALRDAQLQQLARDVPASRWAGYAIIG